MWKGREREREREREKEREGWETKRETVLPGAKIDAKKDTQSCFYCVTKNVRKLPAT